MWGVVFSIDVIQAIPVRGGKEGGNRCVTGRYVGRETRHPPLPLPPPPIAR